MANTNGITLFNLTSEYEGDVTKNCGLTAEEIDNNFYFLRGNDIASMDWDDEQDKFVLTKVNGDKIYTDAIDDYVNDLFLDKMEEIMELIKQLRCDVDNTSETISGIFDEIDDKIAEGLSKYDDRFDDLEKKVINNIFNINTLQKDLENNYTDLNDKLNAHIAKFNKYMEYYNYLDNEISKLKTAVNANKSEEDAKIKENTESIKTAEANINTIMTTINNLKSIVDGNTMLLNQTLVIHKNDIDTIKKKMDNIEKNHKKDADKVKKEIDNLKKQINSNPTLPNVPENADYSQLLKQINGFGGDIANLKTKTNEIQTKLNSLTNKQDTDARKLTTDLQNLRIFVEQQMSAMELRFVTLQNSIAEDVKAKIAELRKYVGEIPSTSTAKNVVDYVADYTNKMINKIKPSLLISGNDVEI